jgi:hypothetical protein
MYCKLARKLLQLVGTEQSSLHFLILPHSYHPLVLSRCMELVKRYRWVYGGRLSFTKGGC